MTALLMFAAVLAAEPVKTASPLKMDAAYSPDVSSASGEPKLALEQVTRPDGVTGAVVAAEPDVANVVAFTFGPDGALYVAETFRQGKGVEDNRGHMDWLEDDLAAQTVEDRRAYMRKFFPDDYEERFGKHHDRIRKLTDTDGDGVFDTSTVFATGFNDIVDGTGAGLLVLPRDGGGVNVYYTCIPSLYLLPDADGDGVADSAEALSTGYGVRMAFRGHDMHGLTRGPDGKIYFSIGDRGYHVQTAEGETVHKPDTGGVFRMNPDGGELELFAHGFRNPQELAWSDFGDLFSVDNNSDSGDQARFVHVMEGSDAGWRMNFQYLEDRGPWNREHMWDPYRKTDATAAAQPAYILPPVENFTDGPSGFVAYPGTGFGEDWNGRYFISDFRGTASKSGVRSFRAPQLGAHFKLTDDEQPFWGVLVTDCDFGPDNRFYISDWVDGWNGVGKARVYGFEDESARADTVAAAVSRTLLGGVAGRNEAELVGLLQSPDRRVRLEAQWQLAAEGKRTLLQTAAKSSTNPLTSRLHGVWGLGQLAAGGDAEARGLLGELLSDEDSEVRVQSAKALSWVNKPSDRNTDATDAERAALLAMMAGEAREAAAAAIAYGQIAAISPITADVAYAYVDLADRLADTDPAVRHAVAFGLSQIGRKSGGEKRDEAIAAAAAGRSEAARLAAVVALRNLRSPLLASYFGDESTRVVAEAARAVHDLGVENAEAALAKLPLTAETPDAVVRRVLSTNVRGGTPDGVKRLLAAAVNADLSKETRVLATEAVDRWADPGNLDLVDGSYRPLPGRDAEDAAKLVAKALPTLIRDEATRAAAIPVAGTYRAKAVAPLLVDIAGDMSAPVWQRVNALKSLERTGGDGLEDLSVRLSGDKQNRVRSQARALLSAVAPARAVESLAGAIESGDLSEKQAAVASLAKMATPESDATLREWLTKLTVGGVPQGLELDLVDAANARGVAEMKSAADGYLDGRTGSLTDQWDFALYGGDAARGRDVFFGNAAASCRRCHVVNGEGAAVGPELSEIGKQKDRRYLLEAIMEPNAKIAEGFATKVLILDSGRIESGIVREQTDEQITLVKPTGEAVVVPLEEVIDEAEGLSGMPADLYKNLSRRDVRDLVEYLTTLTEKSEGEAHGTEE